VHTINAEMKIRDIACVDTAVIGEQTKTLSASELQVKAMSDRAKQLAQQAQQLKARQAVQRAQQRLAKVSQRSA